MDSHVHHHPGPNLAPAKVLSFEIPSARGKVTTTECQVRRQNSLFNRKGVFSGFWVFFFLKEKKGRKRKRKKKKAPPLSEKLFPLAKIAPYSSEITH